MVDLSRRPRDPCRYPTEVLKPIAIHMTKKKMLSAALLASTFLVATGTLYCNANRIGSYDDWVNRKSALAAPHPINHAIQSGKLTRDTSTAELLRISAPTQSSDFGRIKYFWFRQTQECCQVAICVDSRVATVYVVDRDYQWTFFDNPDPVLVDAMQTVRSIRDRLDADPSLVDSLNDELNSALVTLGLPLGQPLPADNPPMHRSGDGAFSGESMSSFAAR